MKNLKNHLIFGLILSGIACLVSPATAVSSRVGSAEDLGVGAALGQPIGVTGKYWLTTATAVDAFMGYHWNHNFDMHADYLWHSFSSFNVTQGRMPFYLGLGGRVLLGDDSQFGMRFPLGLSYLAANDPIELFAEIAPIAKLTGGIDFDIDGQVGVRMYINYMR